VDRRTPRTGHPFDSAAGTVAIGVVLTLLLLGLLRLSGA